MDDILSNNYIESVKGAQKTIFLASTTSIILYALAVSADFKKVKVPLVNVEFEGVVGLSMLFLIFVSLGIYLIIQLNQIKSNFDLIECNKIKKALINYPSIVCGKQLSKIFFICLPSLLLSIAMYEAFKGEILLTSFIVILLSVPYFLACSIVGAVKT